MRMCATKAGNVRKTLDMHRPVAWSCFCQTWDKSFIIHHRERVGFGHGNQPAVKTYVIAPILASLIEAV